MSIINTAVAPFKTEAFHNGKFVTITDETLKGKWSVLIFMPAAFTFNCPTEIEDAAENYAEFQKLGQGQVDNYLAAFLNFNRVPTSQLGIKTTTNTSPLITRTIIV